MTDELRAEVDAIETLLRAAPDLDGFFAAFEQFAKAAEREFPAEHDRLVARRAALLFLDACREKSAAGLPPGDRGDIDAEVALLVRDIREWFVAPFTYAQIQRLKADLRARFERVAAASRDAGRASPLPHSTGDVAGSG